MKNSPFDQQKVLNVNGVSYKQNSDYYLHVYATSRYGKIIHTKLTETTCWQFIKEKWLCALLFETVIKIIKNIIISIGLHLNVTTDWFLKEKKWIISTTIKLTTDLKIFSFYRQVKIVSQGYWFVKIKSSMK